MYFTGFADEAAPDLAGQISATKELGWSNIESRAIDGTNIHDLSDEAFADFLALADVLGFDEAELCALDHPAESLSPVLRIVSFDKDGSPFPVAFQFENGIDETPRAAYERFRSAGSGSACALVWSDLSAEPRRIRISGTFDQAGLFHVWLGSAFDPSAPAQFVQIAIESE